MERHVEEALERELTDARVRLRVLTSANEKLTDALDDANASLAAVPVRQARERAHFDRLTALLQDQPEAVPGKPIPQVACEVLERCLSRRSK